MPNISKFTEWPAGKQPGPLAGVYTDTLQR